MSCILRKLLLLVLVSVSSLSSAALAQGAESVSAQRDLILQQLRLGESMYRDDIIEGALERLYRVAPDHPDGLKAEIQMAVRQENHERAQELLERLHTVAPESDAYRSSQVLVRTLTPEGKELLAMARLYSRAGRVSESRDYYDRLLQGELPTTDLTLEYWQLRAREDGGRPLALKNLLRLVEQAPGHPLLLTVIANYLFSEGQPDTARYYLYELAKQPNFRESAASREYEYLLTLPTDERNAQELAEFAQRYADLQIGARAAERLGQERALLSDPSWRAGREGLALLEQGRNADALRRLQRAVAHYPDNVDFHGGLGLAYLRTGDRPRALASFETARDRTSSIESTSKWVSLIDSTRYWLLLEKASNAAQREDWQQAKRLYQQAHRQDSVNILALVGLADSEMATGSPDTAWAHYRKALALAPSDGTAQRGVTRYLSTLTPVQAIALLDDLPKGLQRTLVHVRRDLMIASLRQQATSAQDEMRWADASELLRKAQLLDLDDPWLSYQLARSLREQGLETEAMAAYRRHLDRNHGAAESHYAHALLLSSVNAWQPALDSLNMVEQESWTPGIHALSASLLDSMRIDEAAQLWQRGDTQAAIALLEHGEPSSRIRLQIASWTLAEGDDAKAQAIYAEVLRDEPDNLDAQLGLLEVSAVQGRLDVVRVAMADVERKVLDDISANRRVAALWTAVGDPARARDILERLDAQLPGNDALLLRDLARLTAEVAPQRSLDLYARSLQAEGVLAAEAVGPPRDDIAFTYALREEEDDDWLKRGLRRDAARLYKQQGPTITLHNDMWGRRGGTPGVSRLEANTTMLHLDHPLAHGKVFLRADHVRMDPGTFELDEDGAYSGRFGTCSFGAPDTSGNWQALRGCNRALSQKAHGTSVALGWHDERISVDIGTTPLGFRLNNMVGGASYKGSIGRAGWSLTASRRPMSNSVLSFAGMKDPRTGIEWGAVVATGGSLGLSWDQGEENGYWADISHHRITGKNVADNHRTRLMAGYYRRLINKPHERLIAGVNVMYWRYAKDLSEYTLGQGGYYSPQRYTSVSLPVSYARRTSNWSFIVQGSVSLSAARTRSGTYHPLTSLIRGPSQQLYQMGVTHASLASANAFEGGSSSGVGYSLRGAVERRLGSHWVAGAAMDWQHSQDYSPSRFMMYLRYSFEPWQGSLDLPPSSLEPYADFK